MNFRTTVGTLLVVGGVLLISVVSYQSIERGRLHQQIAHLTQVNQALDSSMAVWRRTRLTPDTLRETRVITRWNTLVHTDTLPGRVDTLVAVQRLIQAGDTLAQVCRTVRSDYDTLGGYQQARISTADSATHAWAKLAKGPLLTTAIEPLWDLHSGQPELAGVMTLLHNPQLIARVELPWGGQARYLVGLRIPLGRAR